MGTVFIVKNFPAGMVAQLFIKGLGMGLGAQIDALSSQLPGLSSKARTTFWPRWRPR